MEEGLCQMEEEQKKLSERTIVNCPSRKHGSSSQNSRKTNRRIVNEISYLAVGALNHDQLSDR